MRVNNIQNYNNNPSFGTIFGVGLANRLMQVDERKMLNPEHIANIEKIKNDGNTFILDLTDKYKIVKKNNAKGIFKKFLYLTLSDVNGKEVELKDMTDVLTPFAKDKNVFHISKFLKIFESEYKLADKVIENSKTLEQ